MKGLLELTIVLSICRLGARSQQYNAPYENDIRSVIPPLKTTGLFGANNYGITSNTWSFPSLLAANIFPAGSPIQSIFSRNPFLSAHSAFASPLARFLKPAQFIRGHSEPNEAVGSNLVNEGIRDYNKPYGSKNLNEAAYFNEKNYPQLGQNYQQPGPNYQQLGSNFQQPSPNYPHIGLDYPRVGSDSHQAGPDFPNPGPSHFSSTYLEKSPVPFNLDSPQPPSRNQPNQIYPSLEGHNLYHSRENAYSGNVIPAGVPFSTAPKIGYVSQPPRYQQPVDNSFPATTEDYDFENDDGRYTAPAVHSPMEHLQYGQSNMVKPIQAQVNSVVPGMSSLTNIKLNLNGPPIIRYLTSSHKPPSVTQNEIPDDFYKTQTETSQPVKEEEVVYAGPLPKSNNHEQSQNPSYALRKIAIPHATYISNNIDNLKATYSPKLDSQSSLSNNYPTQPSQSITPQSISQKPYEMVEYNYDYTYPNTNTLNSQTGYEAKGNSLGYLKYPLTKETMEATEDGHLQPIPMQDASEEQEPIPSNEFTCIGRTAGHYGDSTHGCQVFHICQSDGRHDKFYCPKGTLFNKATNVCDFPYKVIDPC